MHTSDRPGSHDSPQHAPRLWHRPSALNKGGHGSKRGWPGHHGDVQQGDVLGAEECKLPRSLGATQSSEAPHDPSTDLPPVVDNFMKHHSDLVSEDIGMFPEFEYCIKLAQDAMPIAIKSCPVAYAIEEKVADAVHLLHSQGIWGKTDKGDGAHPLITPTKPDGTVRVTMNHSHLNKFVMLACLLFAMLTEIFQKLHGSAFISTLDLCKAYHHISLHPES